MSFGTQRRLSRPVRRIAFAVFVLAWLLVAVAGLAELFLAGYAEGRAAHSLERNGTDVSVKIEARPAVKLLFGRADEVVVRASTLGPSREADNAGNGLGDLIARTKAADCIDARIDSLVTRRVTLRDAHLVKRGDRLTAAATVTRRAIEAALPGNLKLSASGGSGAFEIKGTARALGRTVTVRATIGVSRGRLVIAPQIGGVAVLTLALLDDPRVSVDHVSATAVPAGYRFTADGHLT